MSQIHLYGSPFTQLNPPTEWQSISVEATVNDSTVEAGIDEQELIFEGSAGEFIKNWVETPGKGVFNSIPYRIIYESNKTPGDTSIRFDGYIDLCNMEYLSYQNPVRIKAPVKRLDDPATVIEQMAVLTQGLLVQKGYLNSDDYVDVPVIRESKKNVAERTLILSNYGSQVVMSLTQMVNNMLSAISDVLGLSVLIGVVELLTTFVNGVIVINKLYQQGLQIKDLFWPEIAYYKAASFKTILTKAYAYKGYTIDFGILDTWLSKTYLMASQNEFNGYPAQGIPATGELKSWDYGYIIGEIQEKLQEVLNTRTRIVGSVVNMKTKIDPYWNDSPSYSWPNTLVQTAGQHNNGTIKFDTENVKATVMINYAYDMSDAHTLTAKNGDSHEVHRDLIVELDPDLNSLKGIHEVQIPWAMAVRKQPFDNLWDLFTGISGEFDFYLQQFQTKINDFIGDLNASGVDVSAQITAILNQSGIGGLLSNREGCLKIDDNSFAIPKVIWLDDYSVGKRIPTNFKDFIGAKALYDDYHKPFSPADVAGFNGQYWLYNTVSLKFSYEKFNQTQDNPYFYLNGYLAKFRQISWVESQHSATTDFEQQRPFDENITENEI